MTPSESREGVGAMELVVGAVVWLVANLAYLDFRRTGQRGFKRLVAFWCGWPTTFVTLLVVSEGSAAALAPPIDDQAELRRLVLEVREDRRARGLGPPPRRGEDGGADVQERPGRSNTGRG